MSKKRPSRVFEVHNKRGEQVVVIARHSKGAKTIAQQHLKGITPLCKVRELSEDQMSLACNGKDT